MSGWKERVRKVTPYVPGEQPSGRDVIKLNTNENPYPPAPGVARALREIGGDDLRRYPAPDIAPLTGRIAERYGLDADRVFVGVGSDDVLSMCFLTFFRGPEPLLFPEITYSFYSTWAEVYGIPYERIPLNDRLEIDPADYCGRSCSGIIFANPNAPTGLSLGLSAVEKIAASNPDRVVIVDEAYVDFGGDSAVCLLDKYENLLVVQTFSKSRSLAGMRIGYALGSRALIRCLNDVKFSVNSYTMNRAAIGAGCAALEDEAYFEECLSKIVSTRERAKEALASLGFSFPDSRTNFILASHRSVPASKLYERLKEEEIYVRYFNTPGIDNCLRITVGTDAEMDALFAALRRMITEEEAQKR